MEQTTAFGALNYLVLGSYITAMIAIGLAFAGRQSSLQHYVLAGRSLPWIAVAMSMYASVTSAMTFMGLPGMAYRQNLSLLVVSLMSPLVAPILIFLIYPLYRRLRITTSYEYILHRFGPRARYAVAGLFICARLSWLATVIYAPALALHVTTDVPLGLAIVLIGGMATIYCVLGGLSAVVWTDVPQFIIMIGGAVWIAAEICLSVPGGFTGILAEGHAADKLVAFNWSFRLGEMTALGVAIAYFFILIQDYGVDQVTVQRMMAIKDDRGVTKAILFNAVTDFVIIALLLFVGLGLFIFYQQHPGHLPPDLRPDRVLPWFILHELPAGISGLLIAALFAAAMSSVDSGLNSLTTVILHDIAGPLRTRSGGTNPWLTVNRARLLTFLLGVTASLVALLVYQKIEGIIRAFYTYMGLFSAPVLALFLLGMLTRSANALGWMLATLVSITTILTIKHLDLMDEIHLFPLSTLLTFILGFGLSHLIPDRQTNPNASWSDVMRR